MPETRLHSQTAPRPARARDWRRALSLAVLVAACLSLSLSFLLDARASAMPPEAPEALAALTPGAQGSEYSRFVHTQAEHARLPCLLCHRREDNVRRLVYPGHSPCAGCHSQQFANPASPICTICHTDPQSGAMKAFPPLRTFNVRFDHARHARGAARPRNGCEACHRPERRGVSLSIPAGLGAHATCFQCHSPRAQAGGRDISSCGVCHRVGRYSRTPELTAAYRVNFSHADHERAGLNCNDCHTVRAGMPQRRQVTSPSPMQHHAPPRARSCMTCHDDRRAFGGDDFSDCKRCHEGNTWHF
jgi:c(7)-type cytochrome triheme protein